MFIANLSSTTGDLILKSLKEIYSNESGNIIHTNLLDMGKISFEEQKILEILKTKTQSIFLGDNHSTTSFVGEIFLQKCILEKKQTCLILFGAHFDKSVIKLINSDFMPQNILLVGARNMKLEEIKFVKEKGIRVLSLNAITEDLNDMCDTIMEFADGRELYISINLNIIDPVFAQEVFSSEVGGLTSRQFLYLIQRVKKIRTLKIIDLVGIKESKESNLTIKLGAKILAELI